MTRRLVFLAALLTACVSARAPHQQLFAFHDNFWLNEHLFARVVARGAPAPGRLTADEQAAWDGALALYREKYVKRDLLFDDTMVDIERALSASDGKESLAGVPIDATLRETLERVGPIYRKYWWPEHRASNQAWIAEVRPLVEARGESLSGKIAAAYESTWPAAPIPVDVAVTAGPNNAYTMTNPTHTTISSTEPTLHGNAALEIVFHEASHIWTQKLRASFARATKAQHKAVPSQLWHALLFYNAGELTRRTVGGGYVEYAQKYDVYKQLCGDGCRDRVAAAWNRRLEGTASFDDAIDALVASWPDETGSPRPH